MRASSQQRAPFGAALLVASALAAAPGCGGGGDAPVNERSVGTGAGGSPGTGGASAGGGGASGGGGVAGGPVGGGGMATGGIGGSSGKGGGASGSGGAKDLCSPVMTVSVDVPAGAACGARPVADLSGCDPGLSLGECIATHIVTCGPKCGCSCVVFHLDAQGCAISIDTADASSASVGCLLDRLSKERLGSGLPQTIVTRLGGCNVC